MAKKTNEIILIGPTPLQIGQLRPEKAPVIFIDGGTHHRANPCLQGYQELFSIGDGDSSQEELTYSYPCDKDQSDFSLALKKLDTQKVHFHCYGLFGGRLDHQLAIIGDCAQFITEKSHDFDFYDKNGKRVLTLTKGIFQGSHHGLITVMTLEPQSAILEGKLKYTGEFQLPPLSSRGLSNEAEGEFTIYCEGVLVFLFN